MTQDFLTPTRTTVGYSYDKKPPIDKVDLDLDYS